MIIFNNNQKLLFILIISFSCRADIQKSKAAQGISSQVMTKIDIGDKRNRDIYFREIREKLKNYSGNDLRSNFSLDSYYSSIAKDNYTNLDLSIKRLKPKNDLLKIQLSGIAGSGKTILSQIYAQNFSGTIIWELRGESKESFFESITNFASRLATHYDLEQLYTNIIHIQDSDKRNKKLLRFVQEILNYRSNWLLIVDNVDHYEILSKYLEDLTKYISSKGVLIISTRLISNWNGYSLIKQEPLNKNIGYQLFKLLCDKRNGYTQEDVYQLLNCIYCYPLDITLAGKYLLRAPKLSINAYVEDLVKNKKTLESFNNKLLLSIGYTRTDSNREIYLTRNGQLIKSVDSVMSNDGKIATFLYFISYANPDEIPRSLLSTLAKDMGLESGFEVNLVDDLLTKGIIEYHRSKADCISIHRYNQLLIRHYLESTLSKEQLSTIVQVILTRLGMYLANIVQQHDYLNMSKCLTLCAGFTKLDKQITESNNLLYSKLLYNLGCCSKRIGNSKLAKKYYLASLYNISAIPDQEIAEYKIQLLIYTSKVIYRIDQFDSAKEYIDYAYKLCKQYNIYNIDLYRALCGIYFNIGLYDVAKTFIQKGSSLVKHNLDVKNNYALAKLYNTHAWIYFRLGQYLKSAEYSKLALTFTYKIGSIHTQSNIYYNYGRSLCVLGKYEGGYNYLNKSLLLISIYGNKSSNKVPVLSIMGKLFYKLGLYDEAKEYSVSAIDITLSNDNAYSYANCVPLFILTLIAIQELDYKKAEENISILRQKVKKYYKEIAASCDMLSGILECSRGALKQSFTYLNKALEFHKLHYGKDHIFTAEDYYHLCINKFKAKKYKESLSYISQAEKIYITFYGNKHIALIPIFEQKLLIYQALNNKKEIEKINEILHFLTNQRKLIQQRIITQINTNKELKYDRGKNWGGTGHNFM